MRVTVRRRMIRVRSHSLQFISGGHTFPILDRGQTFRCRLRLMAPAPASVLSINGGSSSIKFAVHQTGTPLTPSLSGKLDRIGSGGMTLSWHTTESGSG